jgi:hypothetical protein
VLPARARRLLEEICAENNFIFFGARVPTAGKPDF